MDWENHLEKNPIQKIEKNSKNQSEIAACEQKTTSEKANFCSNTVLSLYFKFRAKKLHAAKPLAFSLHFITVQRYTQIVTGRYARCVYLLFVFTMLIHWKWYNIAENSYFSRNRQNGREYRLPCSQKCPNFSRGIQVQT